MSYVVGDGLVAFVRLAEGGTVELHAGDTVPASADPQHVARLAGRRVLTKVESKPPNPRGKPSSNEKS